MHGIGIGGGMHATVEMPSSLQARNTRSAISPRLAMRILSNIMTLKGEWRIGSGE